MAEPPEARCTNAHCWGDSCPNRACECACHGSDDLGWWSISSVELLKMLRRVHAGEDPDLVYAEVYANSDHEHPGSCDE